MHSPFDQSFQRLVAAGEEGIQLEAALPQDSKPSTIESAYVERASMLAAMQPLLQDESSIAVHIAGEQDNIRNRTWTPVILRPWVLVLFTVVFILLILALEIVWKVSTSRRGFSPTKLDLHYVWTYGPTAGRGCASIVHIDSLVTVVLQVAARHLSPATSRFLVDLWHYVLQNAKSGSTVCTEAIILTLVTAFWTQVNFRSRQMQPWRELIRKAQQAENNLLLDYISPNPMTGFFRSLRKHHWPVSAAIGGSFLLTAVIVVSTGLFSPQTLVTPQSLPFSMKEQFRFNDFKSAVIDDVAAAFYAGNFFMELNYRPGTNSHFAVELFNTSKSITANTYNLTANATTFTAGLACEPAQLVGGIKTSCPPSSGCTSVSATLAVENANCAIPSIPNDGTRFNVKGNGMGGWYGDVFPGTCQEHGEDSDQERLVVFAMNMAPGQEIINSTFIFTNSTALICKPSFTIQQSIVTIDESGSLRAVENFTQLQTPQDITSTDVSKAVRVSINQLGLESWAPYLANENALDGSKGQVFGSFLALILASQEAKKIGDVLDHQSLAQGAQSVFRAVAVQIAKRYLLAANTTNPSSDFQGTAEYSQKRLFVRPLPLRLLQSMLGVLAIISTYLVFRSSRNVTPQDPASIARLTSLISQSGNLIEKLSLTGSWPVWSLKHLLQGSYTARYASAVDGRGNESLHFVIEHHGAIGQKSSYVKEEYWRPLTTMWFARVTLLAVPLCIIVALEVTLQRSLHRNGLLEVNPGRITQLGSSFIPALVMVLIELLYSVSNSNLRILDPYIQLRNGVAKAKSSILNRSVYTWKTDAFWDSFLNGRIAVGASTLALVFASFLTIVASDLYAVERVAHQNTMNLTRSDIFFNPTSVYHNERRYVGSNTFDGYYKSALAARLAAHGRMSSPSWTFGQYVVPHLQASTDIHYSLDNASSIALQVPVQQGALTCTLVPTNDIALKYSYPSNISYNHVDVRWVFHNATTCQNLVNNSQAQQYLFPDTDGPMAQWTSFYYADNGTECPASWAVYGNWQDGRATELNVITCRSSIQEKQASVQFSLPDWKISSLSVDETTTKTIADTQDTLMDLGNWIFQDVNKTGSIDNVFRAFLEDENTDELNTNLLEYSSFDQLYIRIQRVYSLAYAQVLNNLGRNSSIPEQDPIHSTIVVSSFRLKQSLVSTRIIQGLLLAMVLCSIIPAFTLNLANVVTKNPCSIAAQASLVADSQMMARLPTDSQWMDDKEFKALFEGFAYSMNWSGKEKGNETFGIDFADVVLEEQRKYKPSGFSLWTRIRKRKRATH